MKAAIVYLTRSSSDEITQLSKSLSLIEKNFLPWSPADIFVFHEADFDKTMLTHHEIFNRLGVVFAQVDFSSVPPGTESLSHGQRGYRHMCHFFANDIFLRNELRPYRFYMRLDVDSFILSKVRFNVFEKMNSENRRYAYRMVMTENPSVAQGLLETATSFFSKNPSLAKNWPTIHKIKLYYTNFEICDLSFFRDVPWQRFFAAIDAAGGMWSIRWGDAPVRWLGLQYLLHRNEVWFARQITYRHRFVLRRGFGFRLPIEYARSVFSVLVEIARIKFARKKGVVCASAR